LSFSERGIFYVHNLLCLGANGIIGIGTTTTDCGTFCTVNGGSSERGRPAKLSQQQIGGGIVAALYSSCEKDPDR
jgi:hypothetical protein